MTIKKYLLNFLFIYFIFHLFSFLFALILNPLIYWSASALFHIEYSFDASGFGSGDNTYKYLETFWHLCLSLILAIPVSMQIRQITVKNSYAILRYLFEVTLRLYLVFFMLIYGFSKVFPFQFPPLHYFRLAQPYGESSPMGLAWTFMQYSPYYTAFTGLAEVTGGLLLLNRKTVTLGAVILTGVTSNIVMMNFCYDIPVKLSSMHMLLAALILLYFDRTRLLYFFIQDKAVPKKGSEIYLGDARSEKILHYIKTGFKLVLSVGIFTAFSIAYLKMQNQDKKEPVLYGCYEVVPSEKPSKYLHFVFETYDGAGIRYTDNTEIKFTSTIDTMTRNIILREITDDSKSTGKTEHFRYEKTKNGLLLYTKDSLEIDLKRKTKEDFLLTNRGFHWINETPFNR
ncbi:hypothetical protein [Flavobacterium cerinum]|uniref:DoxX family protein n=1 Tax=Flavobacterium cerinum TaxID=2502784 RepID=A0ABY5ITA7_9FLAO|nr:hypothetical protein [Flavobacterium cerinum]UUC46077.1 hypothetical protein NOX80_02460 [Flavobacterium cerinum]